MRDRKGERKGEHGDCMHLEEHHAARGLGGDTCMGGRTLHPHLPRGEERRRRGMSHWEERRE